jgi:hypothetical protein
MRQWLSEVVAMIVIYIPLLIALLGLLLYFIADPVTKPKIMEVGRLMFFIGLLVFLLLVRGSFVVR